MYRQIKNSEKEIRSVGITERSVQINFKDGTRIFITRELNGKIEDYRSVNEQLEDSASVSEQGEKIRWDFDLER